MANIATYLDKIKQKKQSIISSIGFSFCAHPHRLASVDISGTLNYVIDERDFSINASPTNGDVAFVYTYSITATGIAGYTRIFSLKQPYSRSGVTLATGEFLMSQEPLARFWAALVDFGTLPDYETVGSVTRDRYIYASGTSTWDLDSSTSNDMDAAWDFDITTGGDEISGGKDDDSADENCTISFAMVWSGTHSAKLPSLSTAEIKRLPWVDAWASETSAINDAFTSFLTTRNAADGGGHSGTCTVSLDFS